MILMITLIQSSMVQGTQRDFNNLAKLLFPLSPHEHEFRQQGNRVYTISFLSLPPLQELTAGRQRKKLFILKGVLNQSKSPS